MNMFTRARQGLTLTPSERTVLKLIKAIVYAVLAFLLGGQGLAIFNAIQQPNVNVGTILHDQLLTPVLMIVLLAAEKWFTAQGDAPLADALGAVAKDLPQPPPPAAPSPTSAQPTPTPVLPGMTVPLPAPPPFMGSATLTAKVPPGMTVQYDGSTLNVTPQTTAAPASTDATPTPSAPPADAPSAT